MQKESRSLTVNERTRIVMLALLAIFALAVLFGPRVFAAWDQTKPANNSALVSADIRANWSSLQAALGNPDTVPLSPPVAVSFQSTTPAQFFATPTYKPGGDSALDATVNGLLTASVDTTQRANSGTGLTTLSSYSLPANTLATNGRGVKCTAWGTTAANANVKSLFFKFGGTTASLASGGSSAQIWTIEAWVFRTGAATQKMIARSTMRNGAGDIFFSSTAPAETLSGAVTILTQGQSGTASNDVLQEGFYCEAVG